MAAAGATPVSTSWREGFSVANRRNLSGERFGRLIVLCDSGRRTGRGTVIWECQCDCTNIHYASTDSLRSGSVRSCKCLARELSSIRQQEKRRPPKVCKHPECDQTTEKGGFGYCGMHAQRVRRYGDPDYVTPTEVWRKNNRGAQLRRFTTVKASTYRKLYGRHEHRVVAEALLGRPLKPDEHVHHRDEDKHNNSPENLVVLSATDHLALHAKRRRRGSC